MGVGTQGELIPLSAADYRSRPGSIPGTGTKFDMKGEQMKKLILLGLVSLVLAGCSRSVAYTVVHRPPVDDRIVNQRILEERTNFLNLVMFMRDTKTVSVESKNEVIRRIESAGFGYICEHNRCFMHRGQVKVQIQPDHIFIEYPDRSYKRIWDVTVAADLIYKN